MALIVIATLIFASLCGPPPSVKKTIPNTLTIVIKYPPHIGIYSDENCTITLTSIDWGDVYNGTYVSKKIWVKNEGTYNITVTLAYGNYSSPTLLSDLNPSFLYDIFQANELVPDDILEVTLGLSCIISPQTIGPASFDITVEGIET